MQKRDYLISGVFIAVWGILLLMGTVFFKSGDEMGYSILAFYVILPVTSFICSLLLGSRYTWWKWIMPVAFGLLGCILAVMVFRGSWDWISLFFGAIPAIVGMVVGIIIGYIRKKRHEINS